MDGTTFLRDQYLKTVTDTNWRIAGVGDFDKDGNPDLLWQNTTTGDIYVWYLNGATFVRDQYIQTIPDTNWHIVGAGAFGS